MSVVVTAIPLFLTNMTNIQIVTGIEVSSESYFPKLWEYCPSAEGTRAKIKLTIDR